MKRDSILLWCFRIISPILFYMLFCQVMAVLILVLLSAVLPDIQAAYHFYNSHLLLVTAIMSVSVLPLFVVIYRRDKSRGLGLDAFCYEYAGLQAYGLVALLGLSFCIAANQLIMFSRVGQLFDGYQQVSEQLYQKNLVFELITMGLLIPLTEELLFRGLCFKRLRERLPFASSAFFSALLFALYHGNVVQGIYAFVMGFIMAFVYERCRSFAAPYVFHVSANILSVLITETGLGVIFAEGAVFYISMAISIIISILGVYLIQRKVKLSA